MQELSTKALERMGYSTTAAVITGLKSTLISTKNWRARYLLDKITETASLDDKDAAKALTTCMLATSSELPRTDRMEIISTLCESRGIPSVQFTDLNDIFDERDEEQTVALKQGTVPEFGSVQDIFKLCNVTPQTATCEEEESIQIKLGVVTTSTRTEIMKWSKFYAISALLNTAKEGDYIVTASDLCHTKGKQDCENTRLKPAPFGHVTAIERLGLTGQEHRVLAVESGVSGLKAAKEASPNIITVWAAESHMQLCGKNKKCFETIQQDIEADAAPDFFTTSTTQLYDFLYEQHVIRMFTSMVANSNSKSSTSPSSIAHVLKGHPRLSQLMTGLYFPSGSASTPSMN